MSLKGTERDISLKDVPKVRKAVADKNISALSKYVESGVISTEVYNQIIEELGTIPNKPAKDKKDRELSWKIKIVLPFVVLLLILASIAVAYHNNATKVAYNEGRNLGYNKGYETGYKEGYDKGYSFYDEITDEYWFYHKHAVRVTTTGKKYHRYDCYHVKDRSFYIYNIEYAKAKGYTPCLDCYN